MFHREISGVKRVFGLHRPGRHLVVFPDDVFIVSYPKSGNTWTRFLIANLVYPDEPASFANINRLIPDPEALSNRTLSRLPRPRYIKSHQYFDPRYRKIIYVVRDPRDVAISQYHFHRKRKLLHDGDPVQNFVTRFVRGEVSPYASWGENVASWLVTRSGSDDFLLVRYEDLLMNPGQQLTRVALFLGIEPDKRHIEETIRRSCADTMRKMEQTQSRLWSSTKDTRQDVPFVREAKAGGWKEQLPETSVAEIESAWGTLMLRLGYELTNPSRSANDSSELEKLMTGIRQ